MLLELEYPEISQKCKGNGIFGFPKVFLLARIYKFLCRNIEFRDSMGQRVTSCSGIPEHVNSDVNSTKETGP